jgi:hypothetical protein
VPCTFCFPLPVLQFGSAASTRRVKNPLDWNSCSGSTRYLYFKGSEVVFPTRTVITVLPWIRMDCDIRSVSEGFYHLRVRALTQHVFCLDQITGEVSPQFLSYREYARSNGAVIPTYPAEPTRNASLDWIYCISDLSLYVRYSDGVPRAQPKCRRAPKCGGQSIISESQSLR